MRFDEFDFIHCGGVLHHTGKPVFDGLKELKRILKPEGMLYFQVNGRGGLMRDFMNLLREKYVKEESFGKYIDNLDEKKLRQYVFFIINSMRENNDVLAKDISDDLLKTLFDVDLVLTIKDRIQATVYTETSEDELLSWLKENEFQDIRRLKRLPTFDNIRRFLGPLYYEYDNEFSRLLYGDGMIQLRAKKGL